MKVIDNFLEQDKFDFFKEQILSEYFPWYFNSRKVLKDNHPDNFQFVHTFTNGSSALPLLDVFKDKLNIGLIPEEIVSCYEKNKITNEVKIVHFKSGAAHKTIEESIQKRIYERGFELEVKEYV